MRKHSKILFLVLSLFFVIHSIKTNAFTYYNYPILQIDSLINETSIKYDLDQLDLLILYHEALKENRTDSITLFKKVALLNAELEQPKDAYLYTKKYINNTLDFTILNNNAYQSIANTKQYKDLKETYLPSFTILSFVYLYVALIGFFFAIIINFTKSSNSSTKLFIACFIGVHSLFILEFVLYITNYRYQFPHTFRMSAAAALLFGPLLYFYFKSVIQDYKFKWLHLLHFLPTVVLLIYLLPIYFSSQTDKIEIMLDIHENHKNYASTIFILKLISLIIYTFLTGKLLFNHQKGNTLKPLEKNQVKWKKNIYRIHVAYVVAYLFYGVFIFGSFNAVFSFIYYLQIGVMSVIVLYIAYMAFVQPSIFSNEFIPLKDRFFSKKYKKSSLTHALSFELKDSLISLLVEEKIYKENDINLDKLAQKLNTTRHNASQIINEHFKMNFFELINKFRIEEAIRVLKNDTYGSLNIIDIAYEVGYNNKVTFNKAFKKETALTPSEFIQSYSKIKPSKI